jgi:hypothetical protein
MKAKPTEGEAQPESTSRSSEGDTAMKRDGVCTGTDDAASEAQRSELAGVLSVKPAGYPGRGDEGKADRRGGAAGIDQSE